MRIDGVEWTAAHDVFGAVHPTGYDRSILIAGSRWDKNANEQAFNLNLFGINRPGVPGDPNLDRSLCRVVFQPESGAAAGRQRVQLDLKVEPRSFSKDPDRIEARFAGTLSASDGTQIEL